MDEKIKMSQKDKILAYIAENGSATVRDLFLFCNINSPTKRLSELRKAGLIIEVWETRLNRSGENKRYKRYYLSSGGRKLYAH